MTGYYWPSMYEFMYNRLVWDIRRSKVDEIDETKWETVCKSKI